MKFALKLIVIVSTILIVSTSSLKKAYMLKDDPAPAPAATPATPAAPAADSSALIKTFKV